MIESWMAAVCAEASASAPAEPAWSESRPGVPLCDESCSHHDGKRCQLMGFRPSAICEPVVGAMASMLTTALASGR